MADMGYSTWSFYEMSLTRRQLGPLGLHQKLERRQYYSFKSLS